MSVTVAVEAFEAKWSRVASSRGPVTAGLVAGGGEDVRSMEAGCTADGAAPGQGLSRPRGGERLQERAREASQWQRHATANKGGMPRHVNERMNRLVVVFVFDTKQGNQERAT